MITTVKSVNVTFAVTLNARENIIDQNNLFYILTFCF